VAFVESRFQATLAIQESIVTSSVTFYEYRLNNCSISSVNMLYSSVVVSFLTLMKVVVRMCSCEKKTRGVGFSVDRGADSVTLGADALTTYA
jgi:hypothetical protein